MDARHPTTRGERLLRAYLSDLSDASSEARERAAAVRANGSFYRGVPRPKGIRAGKPGNCFGRATTLSLDGRGTYVEGFALGPGSICPVHHAWITTDGASAIEVVWPRFGDAYLGIAFPSAVVARHMLRRKYFGVLDPVDDEINREILESVAKLERA